MKLNKFLCRVRKNKEGTVSGFEFVFRISLHKDDKNVLEFISSKKKKTKQKNKIFSFSFPL